MEERKEYIITDDDDDHWYVVSTDDEKEFNQRIANNEDFDDLDVTPVGGAPSLVKFKSYRIE
jgi:hypothetical protein